MYMKLILMLKGQLKDNNRHGKGILRSKDGTIKEQVFLIIKGNLCKQ